MPTSTYKKKSHKSKKLSKSLSKSRSKSLLSKTRNNSVSKKHKNSKRKYSNKKNNMRGGSSGAAASGEGDATGEGNATGDFEDVTAPGTNREVPPPYNASNGIRNRFVLAERRSLPQRNGTYIRRRANGLPVHVNNVNAANPLPAYVLNPTNPGLDGPSPMNYQSSEYSLSFSSIYSALESLSALSSHAYDSLNKPCIFYDDHFFSSWNIEDMSRDIAFVRSDARLPHPRYQLMTRPARTEQEKTMFENILKLGMEIIELSKEIKKKKSNTYDAEADVEAELKNKRFEDIKKLFKSLGLWGYRPTGFLPKATHAEIVQSKSFFRNLIEYAGVYIIDRVTARRERERERIRQR